MFYLHEQIELATWGLQRSNKEEKEEFMPS
jgi:hypothetical protein